LKRHSPSEPDLLSSSRKNFAELAERSRVEVLLGNTGDENGLGHGEASMLLGSEEVLTKNNESRVFATDEVENPDCESKDQVP